MTAGIRLTSTASTRHQTRGSGGAGLRSRTLFTALNNVRYDLAALGPVGRRLERTTSGPWTGAAEISAKIGHKAASVTLGNEALHETGAVQRAGQASEHLGFHALLGPGLCRPQ